MRRCGSWRTRSAGPCGWSSSNATRTGTSCWIARQTYTHVAIDDGYVRFRYEPPTEVRMYEVADLLQSSGDDPDYAADALMELVSGGTGWESWDVEDASIQHWDGMLVVDSQNLSGDPYICLAMGATAGDPGGFKFDSQAGKIIINIAAEENR